MGHSFDMLTFDFLLKPPQPFTGLFFTIIIIKCKVSFSSHSSSSHYSMQGFVFIIISSFWGGFIVNINKLYDF